jgi:predicted nuclease of predicted toxin-antitoxin system
VNSLFICLYLDEDVNVLIANLLRARGFDVITARDAEQLHVTDAEQLAYAVSQARTLVTHNRTDFEKLVQSYFDSEQMHYGVIFAVRRPPQEIAQRLLAILNHVTVEEMQNQVRYI